MKQRIRFGKRACCVAATMCVAAAAFLLPTSGSAGASTVKGSTYELYYTETGATPAGKYLPAISDAINATRGYCTDIHSRSWIADDNGDPNQATQCAQQATSNPQRSGDRWQHFYLRITVASDPGQRAYGLDRRPVLLRGRLQVTASVSVQRRIPGPGCGRSSWGD